MYYCCGDISTGDDDDDDDVLSSSSSSSSLHTIGNMIVLSWVSSRYLVFDAAIGSCL